MVDPIAWAFRWTVDEPPLHPGEERVTELDETHHGRLLAFLSAHSPARSTQIAVRVGTVVALLTYQNADKNPDNARVLLPLARAQADRLLRAQQGGEPGSPS
ncbi:MULTISPECIES: hypothetical protein [Streptomyces]|uniref:hypothetical protein n=1 Tax=Streptomyces TaxID=1883 RepID=UPI0028BD8683|nr:MULTISPECIES: hypothetical protein [Streptomyces]